MNSLLKWRNLPRLHKQRRHQNSRVPKHTQFMTASWFPLRVVLGGGEGDGGGMALRRYDHH